jgi:hypothetical protein
MQQPVQEQPAQHLVAKLGPSRESTAKSRQVLMLILERTPYSRGPFQGDESLFEAK